MEQIILNSFDNYPLSLTLYDVENAKAAVIIIHGMEEHQGRYQNLAKRLNDEKYIVITSDLRGHGKNVKKEDLGYFGKPHGDQNLVHDQEAITKYVKEKYQLPIYLFAHSMGTIITRNLLQNNDEQYQKVALSGLPFHQKIAYFGVYLADIICFFKGDKTKGKLLKKMTIGGFNSKVKNPSSKLSWLSHNQENVQNYFDDELCGFNFTNRGYRDLIALTANMDRKKKYQFKNKNLQIGVFVGEDDPCTGFKEGVAKSVKFLNDVGYFVELHQYANMRHEILNEKDNDKVYQDIIDFFNK